MDSKGFLQVRKKLGKTQKQMAQLLGTSIKAIHSYEQGWRSVPTHVERQLYFLLSRKKSTGFPQPCWDIKKCPLERKDKCPAWELHAGDLCWFINGTICEGAVQKNWDEKMKVCRTCDIWASLMKP